MQHDGARYFQFMVECALSVWMACKQSKWSSICRKEIFPRLCSVHCKKNLQSVVSLDPVEVRRVFLVPDEISRSSSALDCLRAPLQVKSLTWIDFRDRFAHTTIHMQELMHYSRCARFTLDFRSRLT